MDLEKIKKKMNAFIDSAGFDFVDTQAIDEIETQEDIDNIINRHGEWLDDMANDARRSAEQLGRELL